MIILEEQDRIKFYKFLNSINIFTSLTLIFFILVSYLTHT